MPSPTTPTASSQSAVVEAASPFIHHAAPTSLSSLPPPPPPPLFAPFVPPSAAPATVPSPLPAFAPVPSHTRPWSTVAALAPRFAPAPIASAGHAPVFVAPRSISLPRVHPCPGTSVLTLAAARAALANPTSVPPATLAHAKTLAATVGPPVRLDPRTGEPVALPPAVTSYAIAPDAADGAFPFLADAQSALRRGTQLADAILPTHVAVPGFGHWTYVYFLQSATPTFLIIFAHVGVVYEDLTVDTASLPTTAAALDASAAAGVSCRLRREALRLFNRRTPTALPIALREALALTLQDHAHNITPRSPPRNARSARLAGARAVPTPPPPPASSPTSAPLSPPVPATDTRPAHAPARPPSCTLLGLSTSPQAPVPGPCSPASPRPVHASAPAVSSSAHALPPGVPPVMPNAHYGLTPSSPSSSDRPTFTPSPLDSRPPCPTPPRRRLHPAPLHPMPSANAPSRSLPIWPRPAAIEAPMNRPTSLAAAAPHAQLSTLAPPSPSTPSLSLPSVRDLLICQLRSSHVYSAIPLPCLHSFKLLLIKLVRAVAATTDFDATHRAFLHLYLLTVAVLRRSLRVEPGWRSRTGQHQALRNRIRRASTGQQWPALWHEALASHQAEIDWHSRHSRRTTHSSASPRRRIARAMNLASDAQYSRYMAAVTAKPLADLRSSTT